jgi:hypothetical protein
MDYEMSELSSSLVFRTFKRVDETAPLARFILRRKPSSVRRAAEKQRRRPAFKF